MNEEIKLARIEDKLFKIGEQLSVISVEVKRTNGSVAAVLREVGGLHPDGPGKGNSIRERLHRIEGDRQAARLVAEALEQATLDKAAVLAEAQEKKDAAFRRHFAYLGFALGALTLAGPFIRLTVEHFA